MSQKKRVNHYPNVVQMSSKIVQKLSQKRALFAQELPKGNKRAMQDAPHPNKLRMLLTIEGLNLRETAREADIPEGTFRHYSAGEQVIPRRDRIKLAKVIGCDVQD